MTAIATPGASFSGADVDGLDRLSSEFSQAASVCDEVRAACEVIVAASFIFGPFGAAFVAYLKGTVIPWLTKISEALQAMAKVLSGHAQAQRTASSPASLATYATPSGLPASSTTEAPEANGPEDKPLAPGSVEIGRSTGYVMDRDALGELTGGKESPIHPTVGLQKGSTGFALLDQKGRYVDLALDRGKVGEATWFGVDAKGPQVGGAVDGSFNDVDLKLHTAVPLGGDSRLGLQNETTIGVHGSLSAQASYSAADGSGSASLGAEAFAGVQNTTTAELSTPYVTDRLDGTVQYGVGGAALAKVEVVPGHLTVRFAAGLADGPGAKIANSLDVNYGRIATDVGTGLTNLEHSAATALGLSPGTGR